MNILIDRKYKKSTYTIGNLYIDGKWFCNTMEDTDRGLDDSMNVSIINSIKQSSITAIPTGTYELTLNVVSPKYSKRAFYKTLCDGKVPRLLNVKGFEGILIHCGNTAEDSSGCILVGLNKVKGKVVESQDTFTRLYKLLKDASMKEPLTVTIK